MDAKRTAAKIGRPARVSGEKHSKERIFDAAVDLFAEQGYDRTSVRRIAEAVGLTESAVYRHYPGKEAILDAIFAYADSRIYTALPAELDQGNLAGESIFSGLLLPLPRIIMADPYLIKIARIMYAEMLHSDDIRNYFKEKFGEKADGYAEALFRRLSEKGSIKACDPRSLARVFNAFRFQWIFQTFVVGHGETLGMEALEKDLAGPIRLFEELFIPREPVK